MRRIAYLILLVTLLALVFDGPMLAQAQFPEVIPLPFKPEGVAIPFGTNIYVASVFDGQIWRGDVRTGTGEVLVEASSAMAVGLSYDPRTNYLYVAGGFSGAARVYDATTGDLVRSYAFPSGGHFANDVIVTREGAYITDSAGPHVYRLPLGPAGRLPEAAVAEEIVLQGLSMPFMLNGIEATPDGKNLIVADSVGGGLYKIDPASGAWSQIGGVSVPGADGILLIAQTLYVVQGGSNKVSVVQLDPSMATGQVVRTIAGGLCTPATVAAFGPYLYVTNFGTCGSETFHKVVRLPRY